jgi:beta-lactamase regulating signal transducer with metallopeptidase domain
MIAALNLNQLARLSAASMLNCVLEGIAIGLFAWILLRVVGRRNSSTRFAVWFFALVAIAALPILSVAAPSARAGSAGSAITIPSSWALDIFLVWAVIAGMALLRIGVGLWQLRRLRASCAAIDPTALDSAVRETLQGFQAVRSVTLCQSDRLKVPTAVGFLKPLVVIPTWALHELSGGELNSILIHELAHLRRRDDWTNLAQQILKALLFFHPAVWWIESKLALEREMACDDAVLAETANPRSYAQCLISVAEKSFMRRGVALAQAAVNRMRQTSLRVSQILDVNRSSAVRVWKPALYSVAAFFVACLASLSHAPELVAFKDQAPDAMASASMPGVTLTSATEFNSFAKQAIVTPATFHVRSNDPRSHEARSYALTNQPARQGAASAVPRIDKRHAIASSATEVNPAAERRYGRARHGSGGEQNLEDDSPAGTTLAAATGLLNSEHARVLDTRFASAQIGHHVAAPQTILVVMQSTQYDEAGPMLWRISVYRVTVVDSTRIPAETRIPKKI